MALPGIEFSRENGGFSRKAASEDSISGLFIRIGGMHSSDSRLMSFEYYSEPYEDSSITAFFGKLTRYEQLSEEYGVTRDVDDGIWNYLDYQVREFFKYSPNGTLYLALVASGECRPEFITALQQYAGGKIRQLGIADDLFYMSEMADRITDYAQTAEDLAEMQMPLSVIVALNKSSNNNFWDLLESMVGGRQSGTLVESGLSRVSLLASTDWDDDLIDSFSETSQDGVAAIGTFLGCLSAAKVNESVAWVQKFPLDMKLPGLVTGELLSETSMYTPEDLSEDHIITVRSYPGDSRYYFSDSHTLDVGTSDYAYIENVRTMDKATRGIYRNLLPYVNSPLQVDPETGKLNASTVAHLETEAGKALEEMEKAGELSGYRVEIDPEQNVLSTSAVEVVIKQVAVGVMRKVHVKIGFATSLS